MKLKTKISVVDIYFIFLLMVFLIILVLLNVMDFLYKLPYVTFLAFYYIGKYARDYEIKHIRQRL